MAIEDHFNGAAEAWMATNGTPASLITKAGLTRPLRAVLDRNSAEIGEYGVTVAMRPAIDFLVSELPVVEQGSEVQFPDGGAWILERQATNDGYIVRVWVEEK